MYELCLTPQLNPCVRLSVSTLIIKRTRPKYNKIAQLMARHHKIPTLHANVAKSVTDGRKNIVALAHPYHEGKPCSIWLNNAQWFRRKKRDRRTDGRRRLQYPFQPLFDGSFPCIYYPKYSDYRVTYYTCPKIIASPFEYLLMGLKLLDG